MAYRYDVYVLDLNDNEYKFLKSFQTVDEAFKYARKLFRGHRSAVQIEKYRI